MNEETNIITNEVIEIENNISDTVYGVAKNINSMLSVLTFTIIIFFMYKYLKACFKKK